MRCGGCRNIRKDKISHCVKLGRKNPRFFKRDLSELVEIPAKDSYKHDGILEIKFHDSCRYF
jgi:hypothetical protein